MFFFFLIFGRNDRLDTVAEDFRIYFLTTLFAVLFFTPLFVCSLVCSSCLDIIKRLIMVFGDSMF